MFLFRLIRILRNKQDRDFVFALIFPIITVIAIPAIGIWHSSYKVECKPPYKCEQPVVNNSQSTVE